MGKSFEDLEVWKKSCRLTIALYGTLKNCRDYGLKDQMLRAAVSIASNIAEGSERNSHTEFKRWQIKKYTMERCAMHTLPLNRKE